MTKKILHIVCYLFLGSLLSSAQSYDYQKVPSFPRNVQKLAKEIYGELKATGKPLEVFDREIFALDANDPSVFEFFAYKRIGKSGQRSCRFKLIDGDVYYARLIDEETGKNAQGVLYKDMSDKWDTYLSRKKRE
jgi:hypothetical protein